MNKHNGLLTPRLTEIASFVKKGARVLDVGTDHAYIPISLLINGIVDYAWASDVNQGPLGFAISNAVRYGVSDRISFYLSDGLSSCECEKNCFDTVIISGMGGELISELIDKSKFLKTSSPTLILQPMTMQAELRRFLCTSGFRICEETVVFDSGKYYQIIIAKYFDDQIEMTDLEYFIGKININRGFANPFYGGFLNYEYDVLLKIIDGKKTGNISFDYELELARGISSILLLEEKPNDNF